MPGSPVIAALLVPLLQVTVVNRLPFPGAAPPDLVLAAVALVAAARGPVTGTLTGFAAGLAADLLPPADAVTGRSALVFAVVGYGCGLLRRAPVPVTATGGVVAGAFALVGLDMLLRDPRAATEAAELPYAVPYTLAAALLAWLVLVRFNPIRLAAARWRRRGLTARRTVDAFPDHPGARARDLYVPRAGRASLAGTGGRRGTLRPRSHGGSRAPRGRARGARAHRR
ncbi:MAG: rod shape-determining protein MreD [Actinomycetes bacterium]|jgi:rod shape-determining protein MreD